MSSMYCQKRIISEYLSDKQLSHSKHTSDYSSMQIPTTVITGTDTELTKIYSNVLSQVKTANGSAIRSPLLHRRYKNFENVYSTDDSRIEGIDSMEQFKRALVAAHDSLVCVTFSAKWCGPWRMIKPDVHRLSHIHRDVIFYEVDVDDNEEIAVARRVVCMPTFQFFKCCYMLDKFAEPNRIKLDETIRKLRRMDIKEDDYRFEQFPPKIRHMKPASCAELRI